MLNHIVIMGSLTRDPDVRRTPNGVAVTSFTLAVDRDFGARDGDKQTDFIDCVAWRNTADFVGKYFAKGRMAVVSGRLQIREWTDKDGGRRRNAEVVADNVYFGDSKKDRDGGDFYVPPIDSQYASEGYNTPVTGSNFAELDGDDGDLPF